jgi:hypothetical protein
MPQSTPKPLERSESGLDRAFIERERNRFAGRALSALVALNGAAALILLTIMAQAPELTVDRKIAAAVLVFGSGAVAALFSSFLAYVNRTVRIESPARINLRRGLRYLAVLAVLGSGAAFLAGLNMVATAQAERSSSHPKGPRQDKKLKPPRIEKVLLYGVRGSRHLRVYGGPVISRVKSAQTSRASAVRAPIFSPTTSQLTMRFSVVPSMPASKA